MSTMIGKRILLALCMAIGAQPLWADSPPGEADRADKEMNAGHKGDASL